MGRRSWRDRWAAPGGAGELIRLAWPLVLSNSCWTLQIVLDRVLLSRAGDDQVGASWATALVFWVPMNLLTYTANYATTFVAQYLGAGRPERVGPVIWQSLYFSVGGGMVLLLSAPLAAPLLGLAGHEPHLQALEAAYFQCLCVAGLPILLCASACSFFAGRGDSRTVLLVNALGVAVNGALAVPLIFGAGPLPALGIVGAGWATIFGCGASAALALAFLFRRPHRQVFATLAGWRFDAALFRRLMRFGLPNGLTVALDCLGFALFTLMVGRLGPAELDATSIVFTLNLVGFLPLLGVGQAVEVLVGRRLGENDPATAARSAWNGLWVVVGLMIAFAVGYIFFPESLVEVFRSGDDRWGQVRTLAPGLLRFVAVYCLFDAVNIVFSHALRGAGDTRFVTLAALLLSGGVLVAPTAAAMAWGGGLNAAWACASIYIVSLAATFLGRFLQGKWRSMRVIEPAAAVE
jgi:MATE family multidrug resistance protein